MNVSLKNLFVRVYVEGVCVRERGGGGILSFLCNMLVACFYC